MTGSAKCGVPALAALLTAACLTIQIVRVAEAQVPYVGEVITFAGPYCPQDYLSAQGTVLSIADNQELFALLGTAYGGDGDSNFALPNLVGAAVVGTGQGVGRPNVALGQTGGTTNTVGVETAVAKSEQVPKTQSPSLGLSHCVSLFGVFPPPQ